MLDQASQLESGATRVLSDIEYVDGRRRVKTIDVIIMLPEVTLLVEAKTSRIVEAGRRGETAALEAYHRDVLGKAIGQLNKTLEAARRHLLEVSLPRETFGIVVTLEPNYFIEPSWLPRPDMPTTIATLEDFERLIAMALSGVPLANLIGEAVVGEGFWSAETLVLKHELGARNPMLDVAYEEVAGFGGRLDGLIGIAAESGRL